jgi:hypothetical protein
MRYTLYIHKQYQYGEVSGSYWSPNPGVIVTYNKRQGKFVNQDGIEMEVDPQPYKDGIHVGQSNQEDFHHAIVPESHPAYNLILMHHIGHYRFPNYLSKREELYKVPTIILNNALR